MSNIDSDHQWTVRYDSFLYNEPFLTVWREKAISNLGKIILFD